MIETCLKRVDLSFETPLRVSVSIREEHEQLEFPVHSSAHCFSSSPPLTFQMWWNGPDGDDSVGSSPCSSTFSDPSSRRRPSEIPPPIKSKRNPDLHEQPARPSSVSAVDHTVRFFSVSACVLNGSRPIVCCGSSRTGAGLGVSRWPGRGRRIV